MSWLARLKNQKGPDNHPTKPTKPGFVGFVGTPAGHIQKIEGESKAANDPAPSLEAAPVSDPDRWCWPHSTAMNTVEVDTFTARMARFTDKGLTLTDGETLANKLLLRDREQDDRLMCLECSHLGRGNYCGNWSAAGVAIQRRDSQLAPDFTAMLQRCDGFSGSRL